MTCDTCGRGLHLDQILENVTMCKYCEVEFREFDQDEEIVIDCAFLDGRHPSMQDFKYYGNDD